MIEPRATTPGQNTTTMRALPDPFGTADLPDSVVNQRAVMTVWMSSRPDRTARWGVGVWMDGEQADDAKPFTIGPDGWRGMDGKGLTASEARYIAACLIAAAERVQNAGLSE